MDMRRLVCRMFERARRILVSHIFTTRKRSLRRLCFHRCLSVYGGGCLPHCMLGCTHPQDQSQTTPPGRHPPAQCMLGYTPLCSACWDTGQQAGCTHPTGMHSCLEYSYPLRQMYKKTNELRKNVCS